MSNLNPHLNSRIESFINGICPDCYIKNNSSGKDRWQCACRFGHIYDIIGEHYSEFIESQKTNDTKLSILQVAEILNIKYTAVIELLKTEKLTSYYINNSNVIYKSDLDKFINSDTGK